MSLITAVPGTTVTSAGEIPGIPNGISSPDCYLLSLIQITDKLAYISDNTLPSDHE